MEKGNFKFVKSCMYQWWRGNINLKQSTFGKEENSDFQKIRILEKKLQFRSLPLQLPPHLPLNQQWKWKHQKLLFKFSQNLISLFFELDIFYTHSRHLSISILFGGVLAELNCSLFGVKDRVYVSGVKFNADFGEKRVVQYFRCLMNGEREH